MSSQTTQYADPPHKLSQLGGLRPHRDFFVVRSGLLEEVLLVHERPNKPELSPKSFDRNGYANEKNGFEPRLPVGEFYVVRSGLLEETFALGTGPAQLATSASSWNYDDSLRKDNRFESRLRFKELFVVPLVLAAIAIRISFG